MNSYDLSRSFIDYAFEHPSSIKPNHYALYFFAIEHCNRLGWKKEFGLPTTMTMEAIGIKSYNTYSKTFNELIDFGFFKVIERSKNQYSANIIALSNSNKALDKALDKAFIKHSTKQEESTEQSIDSIDKPIYKEQINHIYKIEPTFKSLEEPKKQNSFTEEIFLQRWKDARKHFDKQPTNIKKLTPFEKVDFTELTKDYGLKDFDRAIQGLFQQKTYPKTRLRPTHFLSRSNFETYLTCFETKEKLFNDNNKKTIQRI